VREQRRKLIFLGLGVATLLFVTVFAGWRWWAELQARPHETSQVASQANLFLARDSEEAGTAECPGQYPRQCVCPTTHLWDAFNGKWTR
jgi:hypothetical protein